MDKNRRLKLSVGNTASIDKLLEKNDMSKVKAKEVKSEIKARKAKIEKQEGKLKKLKKQLKKSK
jgi:septin family protein